jgi:hypothetical protein
MREKGRNLSRRILMEIERRVKGVFVVEVMGLRSDCEVSVRL